jgi:hypothetical protein
MTVRIVPASIAASVPCSPMALAIGLRPGAMRAMAEQFSWREYTCFAEIGTGQGRLAVEIARRHPHLAGVGVDRPAVQPDFEAFVAERGLSAQLAFRAGNFFDDPLGGVDVLVMGDGSHRLIAKAYETLPPGGALIVYGAVDALVRMRAAGFCDTRVVALTASESMLIAVK